MAIEDWDKKLRTFKTILGVTSDAELAKKVIPDTPRVDFHDNFRKWGPGGSTPTHQASVRFFVLMANVLECENMTGQRLIDCNFEEFVESLPDKSSVMSNK